MFRKSKMKYLILARKTGVSPKLISSRFCHSVRYDPLKCRSKSLSIEQMDGDEFDNDANDDSHNSGGNHNDGTNDDYDDDDDHDQDDLCYPMVGDSHAVASGHRRVTALKLVVVYVAETQN